MSFARMLKNYRRSINPPYTRKDLAPIAGTILLLLLLPLTVLAGATSRGFFSKALTQQDSSSTFRNPGISISGAPVQVATTNCTADGSIDNEEQQLLNLINQHRQANGAVSLKLSPSLNKAAAWKSNDMGVNNYFDHDDLPLGRPWYQRLYDCGYTYNTVTGENIAAGGSDVQVTFNRWLGSPGHNANMLYGGFRVIGIGRVYVPNSTYEWYWTTSFGGFDDSGITDVQPPAVSITSPTNGVNVSNSIIIAANASDNVGVTKVEFYTDGFLRSTDTSAPYSYTWDTTTASNGSHSLLAKAYDSVGNIGTSNTISVVVNNSSSPTGDLNNDSLVNVFDLSILLSNWGTSNPVADINNSGLVDIFDLSILLSNWSG